MTTDALLSTTKKSENSGNLRIALICASVVLGMVGMAYAAVPLYQLFCQVTGYGGTTQRAAGNVNGIIDRTMTVRFDSNIAPGLDWTVKPAEAVTDNIGRVQTIVFVATNNSDHEITGTASFNVAPAIAGSYFNKIECFCFTEQTLAAGQSAEMPVTFFLDPDLNKVQELDTVQDITLSYTFYASETGSS